MRPSFDKSKTNFEVYIFLPKPICTRGNSSFLVPFSMTTFFMEGGKGCRFNLSPLNIGLDYLL